MEPLLAVPTAFPEAPAWQQHSSTEVRCRLGASQVSVVGEMTAAALGPGDLLLVSAGPGHFSTVAALAGEARSAGEGEFSSCHAQLLRWHSVRPSASKNLCCLLVGAAAPQAACPEHSCAGADVVAFTSVPPSELRIPADLVVRVPARTMADEGCGSGAEAGAVDTAVTEGGVAQQQAGAAGGPPRLPMGSSYELALQLLCDAVCLLLHRALQVPEGEMRQRHTNME